MSMRDALSDTGKYGVGDTTGLNIISAALPVGLGYAAGTAARAANIGAVRDVQKTIGLEPKSWWGALNPFDRVASGSDTASLGKYDGKDVTFGGIKQGVFNGFFDGGDFTTSLTPQEVQNRQHYSNMWTNPDGPGGGYSVSGFGGPAGSGPNYGGQDDGGEDSGGSDGDDPGGGEDWASGGYVSRDDLRFGTPAGPDEGHIPIQAGEFVLPRKSVKALGPNRLKMLQALSA